MTKYISHSLLLRGNGTVRWGMKAPSCVCPVALLSEWHFLIYNSDTFCSLLPSFFHLFFHLSSDSSSSLVLLSPVLSPLLSFCVHMKGRQGLWQPLKQDWVCVCVGVRVTKEQRVICSITSTALNCIRLLPDLFYDCNMRYLTYHCHKVQQTPGSRNLHTQTRTHTYVTEESWWWSWRQTYV